MAQAVSRRPLTAEARIRARVNPCGICDGQNDARRGLSPSSSPVNIIPPLLFNSYHLKDEQYVRQWQQFRDVSPRNMIITTLLSL
jgi:hypothetical protein